MRIWGIHKTYPALSWWENFCGGFINIGRITVFGENAMHWTVRIYSKKYGTINFRLPFRCFGRWYPLYFYTSPNGTPWASTFYLGKDKDKWKAKIRRKRFGHNFNDNDCYDELKKINNCWTYKDYQELVMIENTKFVMVEKQKN